MEANLTALERAFQLAKSARCANVEEIKARLRTEGYRDGVVGGPLLCAQLRALIRDARRPN